MTGGPPFAVPPGVGWTTTEDEGGAPRVFVSPLPAGPVAVLPGESALIWLAAVEGNGDPAETVAHTTGHPTQTVREDVESLIEELIHRGLLIRTR